MDVESEIGVGTIFRIHLPLTTAGVVAAVAPVEHKSVRGGNETILVAEDHDGLREIARETLTSLGYNVIVACDGEEAVREFEKHQSSIDLLVLDVMLPKRSGPEAYSEVFKATAGRSRYLRHRLQFRHHAAAKNRNAGRRAPAEAVCAEGPRPACPRAA